jgi:hypothetical protein
MTPSEHDTEPAPIRETPPPLPGRAKRSTLATKSIKWIGHAMDRIIPIATLALVAWLAKCTADIENTADDAKDLAGVAVVQGVTGAATASETKVANQAGYDATREKVDATGTVTVDLAVRMEELEAEVTRLRVAAGRRKPKTKPKGKEEPEVPAGVPPVVAQPLPASPAAAVAAQAAPPKPAP